MTAPSNANTSGLEVVAWRIREQPGTAWTVVYDHEDHRLAIADGFESEPYAVTAASAQARIAELEAERNDVSALREAIFRVILNDGGVMVAPGEEPDAIRRIIARATAAEARADRLARGIAQAETLIDDAINGIQKAPLNVVTDTVWTDDPCPMTVVEALQIARAALQQETQP